MIFPVKLFWASDYNEKQLINKLNQIASTGYSILPSTFFRGQINGKTFHLVLNPIPGRINSINTRIKGKINSSNQGGTQLQLSLHPPKGIIVFYCFWFILCLGTILISLADNNPSFGPILCLTLLLILPIILIQLKLRTDRKRICKKLDGL